jgi:lipid-A-disaccharide synthase
MKVLISCGEPSGDLYAGALAREIRSLDPSARIFGLGGERLREGGGTLIEDYRGLTVTGLSEALTVLPRSFATYRRLVQLARTECPDVFVPIDFPELNLRLAGTLQRMGIPVVYYVCPQVWAWRRGRLRSIKRFADHALVIFPFEEAIYRQAGVQAEFVGHPLLELSESGRPRAEFLRASQLDPSAPTVALLPGSRPNEVRAILPDLVRAALLVHPRVSGVQFIVARAPHLEDRAFGPLADLTNGGRPVAIVAIHGRPMVIVYRLSPLTYRLVRAFAHVDTAGMVNLIAGHTVVPELIQDAFTPQAVADEVVSFFRDPDRADRTRRALEDVRAKLGAPGASRRAAEVILDTARASGTSNG